MDEDLIWRRGERVLISDTDYGVVEIPPLDDLPRPTEPMTRVGTTFADPARRAWEEGVLAEGRRSAGMLGRVLLFAIFVAVCAIVIASSFPLPK